MAASHSAGRAYVSAARPGPDKVRAERSGEPVGAVSHTLPRQSPVYSGENVILPEDSLRDISALDVEAEQNMSESEVQNFMRSSEAASQPMNYGPREVSHSVVSMEVDKLGANSADTDLHSPLVRSSLYPGVVYAQQPVVGARPDLSVVNEVSEVSHNPSSRSTLPMGEEARSESPVLHSAVEARMKLENAMNQARSLTGSPLSVFRPVEFESTPVSSYQYRSHVRSEATPEMT